MNYRNESIGAYPMYGGYGGGFGEGGILGLIALLSLFRGNLFGGNHDAAGANFAEMQNQLANVRADLGDVKYNEAKDLLTQTNSLMMSYMNGQFQNAQAIWDTTSRLQECCCATNQNIAQTKYDLEKSILIQGFQNQLGNCEQTNTLQKQISDCCCETNLNMTKMNYEAMLRDQACCCETQKQFQELKCGQRDIMSYIDNKFKEEELHRLRTAEERRFTDDAVKRGTISAVNATIGSWEAAAQFNGLTYPRPSYPYYNFF